MSITLTRGQLWDAIIERDEKDPRYRDRLKADPRGTLEQLLGVPIPRGIDIQVVEERPGGYIVVLPARAPADAELSDADLEQVTGGKGVFGAIQGVTGRAGGLAQGGALGPGLAAYQSPLRAFPRDPD